LIGVRRGVFQQKIFTQKREFKAGNESLRPGALMAVLENSGQWTQLLYLHTDSGTGAGDFGNRFEMFERVAKMRAALAKQANQADRLIALGDLNTMGLNYPKRSKVRITGAEEIAELATFTRMTLATKDITATWRDANGRIKDSDLDHVLHSPGLTLKSLGTDPGGASTAISSAGWPKLAGQPQSDFVLTISDHAVLVGETSD
jgi:endonuclease/exonuclease/phosphatase family metal-dependent hydrolase